MLCVPPESADDHATGDAQDHSVLRRGPVHNEGVGRPAGRSKTARAGDTTFAPVFMIAIFSFQLHCCGVTTYEDWRQYKTDGIIPSSCCKEINGKVIRRRPARPVQLAPPDERAISPTAIRCER